MVSEANNGTLAIHIGANVGYCFADNPLVWVLPERHDNGYVGAALLDRLDDFWRLSRPSRIVLSHSLEHIEDSPEGRERARTQVGLIMLVEVFAHYRSISVRLVHPEEAHHALFERSDMTKRALRQAITGLAKRRGLLGLDPDAAHALVLYEYANQVKAAA